MKRLLAIAALAVGLSFLAPASQASAYDHPYRHHGHHHGHHHHHGSYNHGGYGYGSGYGHGGYSPSYRYRSGYGIQPYRYRSGYRSNYYPSYGRGSGIHLDINGVHILGRPHF